MAHHARYAILGPAVGLRLPDEPLAPLLIRDVGPWDRHPSVTNDAEHVVEELLQIGTLQPGQRLFYFNSEGELDQILVGPLRAPGGWPVPRSYYGFWGFAPGPYRAAAAVREGP